MVWIIHLAGNVARIAVVADLRVVVETSSQIVVVLRIHALLEELRRVSWIVVLRRCGSLMSTLEIQGLVVHHFLICS